MEEKTAQEIFYDYIKKGQSVIGNINLNIFNQLLGEALAEAEESEEEPSNNNDTEQSV